MGWVDLDLRCSTILPTCSASSAIFPSAQADPGRGRNSPLQGQPNPAIRQDGPPCNKALRTFRASLSRYSSAFLESERCASPSSSSSSSSDDSPADSSSDEPPPPRPRLFCRAVIQRCCEISWQQFKYQKSHLRGSVKTMHPVAPVRQNRREAQHKAPEKQTLQDEITGISFTLKPTTRPITRF